jgi:hypothetical protein
MKAYLKIGALVFAGTALGWTIQLFIVPDNPPLTTLQWILSGLGGALMLLSVPFAALVMLLIPDSVGALLGCILAAGVWSFTLIWIWRSWKMITLLWRGPRLKPGTWPRRRKAL